MTTDSLVEPCAEDFWDRPIPELFEAASSQYARRDAVVGVDSRVSYHDLATHADSIAHALLERGVGHGEPVALFCDRGPDAVAAMLGVVKSGAIAVPLVPAHPPDRHRQVLADAGARLVVSDARHRGQAAAALGEIAAVISLDDLAPAPSRLWPRLSALDPAFIVYTSGSTGQPKGVVQTHRNVTRRVRVLTDALGISVDDRLGMFSTYAVGQGLTLTFGAVLQGATLYPFDVRAQGVDRLATWLRDQRITVCYLSASLFRAMARAWRPDHDGSSPRVIRLASERITPDDVALHRQVFGTRTALVVGYSSTETGNVSSYRVGADEVFVHGIVPVGYPADNVRVSIVDDEGREAPIGHIGEIVIEGRYLSPGYWRDEERTGRAFEDVPHSGGERAYRTGDLGRLRADGLLEHHGRKDFRVKVRGFRVELEEVEAVLSSHRSVRLAAVAARPGPGGDTTLVAYLQFDPAALGRAEEVRAFAARRLPDYMIPTIFVAVDELPLTDSGKIDRRRLPDPADARAALAGEYAPARTTLEETVSAVWRHVLSLERVGREDPFLMVGGDSLRAAQIASRLSEALGIDVSLAELLEADTITRQAALLAERVTGR